MQLSIRITAQDLFDFFSTVGKVNEVKIIYEKFTRKSKGIAYVELRHQEAVSQAISLTGQKLLGAPILIVASQAEKNRIIPQGSWTRQTVTGPPKLDVTNLHPDINEDMLKKIFEPFGLIQRVEIVREIHTGRSKCHGEVLFSDHASAKKAKEALDGFMLAGRPLKVTAPEQNRNDLSMDELKKRREAENAPIDFSQTGVHVKGQVNSQTVLDNEEVDKGGLSLGATGRLSLIAKLAAGTGLAIPQNAEMALKNANKQAEINQRYAQYGNQATTPCFQLKHLFNPAEETEQSWVEDIKGDILSQCQPLGGICHIEVDRTSDEGIVYLKAPSIAIAVECVSNLHGRYFGGRVIKANYIPLQAYSYKFPESTNLVNPIVLED